MIDHITAHVTVSRFARPWLSLCAVARYVVGRRLALRLAEWGVRKMIRAEIT